MRNLILVLSTAFGAGCTIPHPQTETDPNSWFGEWQHTHASPVGTRYVHAIGMEPAFLDREVILEFGRQKSATGSEHELGVELEWALTNRIGLAVEAPVTRVSPNGGRVREGIGDIALAPRFILVKTDRFLLSGNLEASLPSGDASRDLGSGELSLGPGLTTWCDLGCAVTLQTRVGTEHGMESDAVLLNVYTALAWSHIPRDAPAAVHMQPGRTTLLAEFGGRRILHGPGENRTTAEALLGASYALDERWEIRGGYQFPVGGPKDIDHGFLAAATFHF